MDRWRDIRAGARAARALLGPRFTDAPAQALLDALLGHWDVALAEAYGVSPTCILNGLVGAVLGGVGDEPADDGHPGDVTLDPSQRRAAESVAPRVLVDAGPGTGKTRTLVARVLHLLRTAGITGPELLVLTFS